MNEEEVELETSPLSQDITVDGKTVTVEIYRIMGGSSWALEVVDEFNNSNVWNDLFEDDAAALNEAKDTISAEGIDALIGSPG